MKTIKFMTLLLALAITAVSCVEKSGKYKSLLAERDSLNAEAQVAKSNYNETLDILNDVEEGFAAIRASEDKMMVDMKGIEGKQTSKKQQVVAQINQIKEILEQNKKRIEQLQRISAQRGKENTKLSDAIKRMEAEQAEKTSMIASLQSELAKKNIQIEELTTQVSGLNSNVAQLNEVSSQQKNTIKTQDANLNSVWYCVASAKELKEKKILSGNGLFKASTVLDKEFDKSVFKQADLRDLTSIQTGSKRAKVLSTHPKESYTLDKEADQLVTIHITNAEKFWSVSKYLVVQQ
jgi:chromosome segregation ATPase